MNRIHLADPTALTIALDLAGCGSSGGSGSAKSSTTSPAGAASTVAAQSPQQHAEVVFATHAGVAFGTFYRFIYAPYTTGAFNPVHPNLAALAKARRAVAVVARELDMATSATRGAPALVALRAPIATLDDGFKAALVQLKKNGHVKLAEIQAANIAISSIKGSAAGAGLQIPEAASAV